MTSFLKNLRKKYKYGKIAMLSKKTYNIKKEVNLKRG